MPIYNKLIRDKIPQIIEQDGKTFATRTLTDREFHDALLTKFDEELDELQSSSDSEEITNELVDLLELIYSLGKEYGQSPEQLEQLRLKKRSERGGFDKKIFLIEVDE